MLTATNTKELGKMEKETLREFTNIQMATSMMECGQEIRRKDSVFLRWPQVTDMKASGQMERKMEKVIIL